MKAHNRGKDRMAANLFLAILTAPVLFLIWRARRPLDSAAINGEPRDGWSTP